MMTRNLQKGFVDALITAAAADEGIKINKKIAEPRLLDESHSFCSCDDHQRMGARRELSFYGSQINRTSDAISVKRGELLRIKDLLKIRLNTSDTATKYHYKDIIIRIDNALKIN